MPGGDGTGPAGLGPMTGRAMGYCAGFNVPGFMNLGFGLGMAWRRGLGRGFGRGFRWRARFFYPYPQQAVPVINPYATAQPIARQQQLTAEDEKSLLEQEKQAKKQEMEILKQELGEIEKRMKELK